MRLSVQFIENNKLLLVSFDEFNKNFDLSFDNFQTVTKYVGGSPYEGDYTITPKVAEQVIPTKEKVMVEDLTILAIPYYDVENTAGGSSVYIGG